MGGNLQGADLEALDVLMTTLERNASQVGSVASSASTAVSTIDRLWSGPDSAAFHNQWLNVHRPTMARAAQQLRDAAATIRRNRQAQEVTSAAEGSTSGSPTVVSTPAGDIEIVDDGSTYRITATDNSDEISVFQNLDGSARVTINGEVIDLTADEASRLEIEAGDGDDVVEVQGLGNILRVFPWMNADSGGVKVDGGKGDDHLIGGRGDDELDGGDGRDYIDGGRGDDELDGGAGKDTVYGGTGDDEIDGGAGNDYIDGGAGDDDLDGGDDDDFLSGGDGVDDLEGEAGHDIVTGGAEVDDLSSTSNEERIFHHDSNVGHSVVIEGDPEFVARVEADLETLRSLPEGRELLESLDASGRETVISVTDGGNVATIPGTDEVWLQADGTPGDGHDAAVRYNPERNSLGSEPHRERPPIVGLYHELLHAEDVANGTLQRGESVQVDPSGDPILDSSGDPRTAPNLELDAVGLPFDDDNEKDIFDSTDTTPATMDPSELEPNNRPSTENDFREAIGEPRRPRY